MKFYLFVLLLFSPIHHSFALEYKEGLKELKNHLTLKKSKLKEEESLLDKKIITGNVLPEINFKGQYLKQDVPSGSLLREDQKTYSLNLSQPLFRGGREFKAIDQASFKAKVEALQFEYDVQNIYSSFTESYFDYLLSLKILDKEKELYKLSIEREKYIGERVKIGKSRATELYSAKAQSLRVKKEIASLEVSKKNLIDKLEYLLSYKINNHVSSPTLVNEKINIKDLFIKLDKHPYIEAKRLEEEILKKEIGIASGEHLPTLDLNGNYYFEREGMKPKNDWDVSLNLTFPLYKGGKTSNAKDKASLRLKQAKLFSRIAYEELSLKLEELVRAYHMSQENLELARETKDLDQKSFKAYKKDYEMGLSNNLDVLNSMNQAIQSEIDYEKLLALTQKNYHLIKIFVGDYRELN